jgi:hypothetical protein
MRNVDQTSYFSGRRRRLPALGAAVCKKSA